jgi:glutamate-1-semialdehyde-2,1-aminomutase
MEMRSRVQKSRELYEESLKYVPGGVQSSRRPDLFFDEFPIFLERARGAHIWDVDGNEYVDWMLSYGPIILGHCNEEVDRAVIEETRKGFLFNLTPPVQLELAKKLTQMIPCAEMVQFVTSGSGATSAAIRIARAFSGKLKVLRWGYHGWHDWAVGGGPGVPTTTTDDTLSFDYNDLDSLEKLLKMHKGNVACIIMMPLGVEQPQKGFLEGVRELADRHGVILIFDEIRSWPRMGLGGAQKYYGVIPDITTISKGIANGYPISAVVGKREFMQLAQKTNISGSYFMNNLAFRAAMVTLREIETKNVVPRLWEIGKQLLDGLKQIIEQKKIRADVLGVPPMPFLVFGDAADHMTVWQELIWNKGDPGTEKDKRAMKVFYNEMARRGIFMHPRHHWYSCFAHTNEDVQKTLEAAEASFDLAQKA